MPDYQNDSVKNTRDAIYPDDAFTPLSCSIFEDIAKVRVLDDIGSLNDT